MRKKSSTHLILDNARSVRVARAGEIQHFDRELNMFRGTCSVGASAVLSAH